MNAQQNMGIIKRKFYINIMKINKCWDKKYGHKIGFLNLTC